MDHEEEILFEVEIEHPTNSGRYSTRRIFSTQEDAEKYMANYMDGTEEELPETEWDSCGPNWKILKAYRNDWDEYITLSRIENFDEEMQEDVDSQDATTYNKNED